ncbi:MAG: hypothetical protein ICV68_09620 [Pyrinomonadaceae bacterium]|nr:hypothetical protein [Pyrinomonadaceae bacterium]
MALFNCLKWPEMRPVTLRLINSMHDGHKRGRFSIPAADFLRVFSPGATPSELAKVATRGNINFTADGETDGTFILAKGERALFDLHREGLVMRLPTRMSGRYKLRPNAFRIDFKEGEELQGCKRILMLVCNRVISVDVSSARVDVRLPNKFLDLCVEFQ